MRRLAAAMVIPVLAILLAALFSPQSPGTEASTLPAASEPLSQGIQPTVDAVADPLRNVLSHARELFSVWAVGQPCV